MGDDDAAVHPELALELVQKLRRKGGWWRLIQTGVLVTAPLWIWVGLSMLSAIGTLVGVAGTAILLRNLIENARSFRASEFGTNVGGHAPPLLGEVRDHILRIGNAATPRDKWPRIKISAREERQLRQLALPTARVRRDD